MKRPILIALIGYIIGILWGLYLKVSIILFVTITTIIYTSVTGILKKKEIKVKHKTLKKSYKRAKIYLHSKESKKAIQLVLICAVLSNIILNCQNKQYEEKFKNGLERTFIATVVEENKESPYHKQYKVKIESNTYLLLKIKDKTKLELGTKIQFIGKFEQPQQQRNYMGFDYKEYLKTKKIYGIVTTNQVKIIKKNNLNFFQRLTNKISQHIQSNLKRKIEKEEQYNLLLGLLLGADNDLNQDLKENFRNSSLSHILAVSGMHISYIILYITILLSKINVSKRISQSITIFILILFMQLTGATASVIRAVSMSCLMLGANILYKKSNSINNISLSLWIILIHNPFLIKDIGMLLSFAGTIGILAIQPQILNTFYQRNRELALAKRLTILEKLYKKIIEIVTVSISAQICILPILVYHFNQLSLTFLLSNILVSFLIGPIILLGLIIAIIPIPILPELLKGLLNLLIIVAKGISNLPFSKITITTPNLYTIISYYITVYLIFAHMRKNNLKLSTIVSNLCAYVNKRRKKLITIGLIISIIANLYQIVPKGLVIHFIDIGQGDSTLILANNKKILIDGGGSNSKDFDIGKNTLIPYLLDKKIITLDYIIISHFDSDHVRTGF